jgi:Flp pilus assembly protein TadG
MSNQSDLNGNANSRRMRWSKISRGQSMVEFALGATVALAVMILGVQFAIIGQAALAVSQGSSALARYVAVNEPLGNVAATYSGTPTTAMKNLLSSSILTNSGGDLTVTITSYTGTSSTTTTTPVATQDRAVVTLSYNAKTGGKIVLPSQTLLGMTFPTTLVASDSQMYE